MWMDVGERNRRVNVNVIEYVPCAILLPSTMPIWNIWNINEADDRLDYDSLVLYYVLMLVPRLVLHLSWRYDGLAPILYNYLSC